MKVFVTGGSGYLGRNVIKYLLNDAKCSQVIAIARGDAAAEAITKVGGTVVNNVDLSNVDKLKQAAQGCEFAVHCAADVTMWSDDNHAKSRLVNVTGTVNVINACKQAGVKKIVCVSTENVLLDGNPLVRVDETHPYPTSSYGPYSTTKRESEIAARALSDDNTQVVIVRPRLIWGRDDTTVLPPLAKAARSKDLKWFSGGNYLTSTVHVLNCCHGIWCALQSGKGGEVYFLTDGEPVMTKQFLTDLLVAAGIPEVHQVGSAPLSVVWAAAALLETVARVTKRPPVVTRSVLATLGFEVSVNDAKARREIGYSNKISIEEGIEEIRQQYAAQNKSVLD